NVRDMHLDERPLESLQRVEHGDRRERIAGRIEDDGVRLRARGLDQVDQFAFMIGLMEVQRGAEKFREIPAAGLDGGKCGRAIDMRLPDPEEIEIWTIEDHEANGHSSVSFR